MILDKETADRKLRRMALEIAERNPGITTVMLVGIKENGIHIARQLAAHLSGAHIDAKLIELSIDKKNPGDIRLSEHPGADHNSIILVDDVANSGRTMLYALKPLLDLKPAKIETLALVERTHKKFPVTVDYVGISISTTSEQNIVVEVKDGSVIGAYIQ
jgi:pyrimidine operon attenuation protein/uracil phosphoribosyltransferase